MGSGKFELLFTDTNTNALNIVTLYERIKYCIDTGIVHALISEHQRQNKVNQGISGLQSVQYAQVQKHMRLFDKTKSHATIQ